MPLPRRRLIAGLPLLALVAGCAGDGSFAPIDETLANAFRSWCRSADNCSDHEAGLESRSAGGLTR